MPKIVVLNNQDSIYDFEDGIITIGRGEDCSVTLPMKSVSRLHARLTPTEEGWLLEDMDSHNGLFINNNRIKNALLKRTTAFRAGDVYLRFELPLSGEELLEIAGNAKKILDEYDQTVSGRSGTGFNMLAAAVAGGNVLLNGVPGEGKTMAVDTMASILGMPFRKIPMTPDTTPQDVLGSEVIIEDSSGLTAHFTPGPVFSNMILADELDRAPAKTQAALLEAMAWGKVPCGNGYENLPKPGFLAATRKITPEEGDTPLAAGLLEHFMMSLDMNYPSQQDEIKMIKARTAFQNIPPKGIINMESLQALREQVRCIHSDEVISYAGRIVQMSRPENPDSPDFIKKNLLRGASTKAASDLVLCAGAKALLHGRSKPECEDVRAMAVHVLRHRILLNRQESDRHNEDDIIRRLLVTVSDS